MLPQDAFPALEQIAAYEVGRGSAALASHTLGSLRRAAYSVVTAPVLDALVMTGFYIPRANPPAAETDGPIGAVQLAAAVQALEGRARLLTDEPCAPVVAAALASAGVDVPLDVAPVTGFDEWLVDQAPLYSQASHLIAVERVGPGLDGIPRNMRGLDMSPHTAPLDRLFTTPAYRIGIGDGGNELGMGSLPPYVVTEVVERGAEIRCAVSCDALIVGGTSNWAAAALVAALAVLRPEISTLAGLLEPAWSYRLLSAIVAAGAVDGVRLRPTHSVDGLDWADYCQPLTGLARIARATIKGSAEPGR